MKKTKNIANYNPEKALKQLWINKNLRVRHKVVPLLIILKFIKFITIKMCGAGTQTNIILKFFQEEIQMTRFLTIYHQNKSN
jgi:hypothetical protein